MSGNAVQSYMIRTAPNTIKMDFNSRLPLNTQPMYSLNYFARSLARLLQQQELLLVMCHYS